MTISNQLVTEITVKKLPSFNAVKNGCGFTRNLEEVETNKLCRMYAKLTVYANAFETKRIPVEHTTDKNITAQAYAYRNSKFYREEIQKELENRGAFDGLTIWDETRLNQ